MDPQEHAMQQDPFGDDARRSSTSSSAPAGRGVAGPSGQGSASPYDRQSPSTKSLPVSSISQDYDDAQSTKTGRSYVGQPAQVTAEASARPPPPPSPPPRAPRQGSESSLAVQPAGPTQILAQTQVLPKTLNEETAAEAAAAIDPDEVRRGKRDVKIQKLLMTLFLISANGILIFASWYWPQHYYIYLPFISLPLVLNSIMIFVIVFCQLKNFVFKPEVILPATPETLVLLMPCYNETYDECTRSLDSLVNQEGIEQHQKSIMIVCDGKVRGPGMEKTTANTLKEDILAEGMFEGNEVDQVKMIRSAYLAWDGQSMDVEIIKGKYKGVPVYCILKQQNQGKRDSLIVSRSFVYNFNRRHERPKVVFEPRFFYSMADWLQNDAGFERVDDLIGMDADTVFAPDCIKELLQESHYPKTVGVCGYVAVDFQHGNWNFWSIYQSAEYTIAQALRRLHQSIATHKVSCLPGCCQLLKVCDETCGDRVLIDLFGYHPKTRDGLIKRIRATASEDRNHVCLMLLESSAAQTRQALRARAFTDVPHSIRVFLSQRRRWTLGATSNDLMLLLAIRGGRWRFNPWERIVAFSNVLTWCLNPFVIASLGCMIYAFMNQPVWIIMIFASIMIFPLLFYLTMTVWMPRTILEKAQFLLGLTIFATCGPFINIGVTLYAIKNMDNFGWGKTRKVIAETGEAEEGNADEQRKRLEQALNNNEKIVGSQEPDEENQLSEVANSRTPFTAEPPKSRGRGHILNLPPIRPGTALSANIKIES